jgi:hypothetical protein
MAKPQIKWLTSQQSGLIKIISYHLPQGTGNNHVKSIKVADIHELQTVNLLNTSLVLPQHPDQERYFLM